MWFKYKSKVYTYDTRKIGSSREAFWLFKYGELVPLLIGAAILIPGLFLYNKNR
ncbi:hypothetical protein [Chryseobacterium sp. R2ACT005]|jgi:hypothetical protein|uniref:hypothetical protein n=1 Tax=Chryseobacterium sp. R2ACT005 TaxID=3416668 RepID=UPI003CE687ED